MKTVVYKGTANFREFTKSDLSTDGFDHKKISFERGVPVEIDDDGLAQAMADGSGIFADEGFELVETDDAVSEEQSTSSAKHAATSANTSSDLLDGPDTGAALQEDTGAAATPAAGTGTTGAGTTGATGATTGTT